MRTPALALSCAALAGCWREDVQLLTRASDAAPDAQVCRGERFPALGKELEVFVLLDNSASMGLLPAVGPECLTGMCPDRLLTPWEVAIMELVGFVHDPRSAGVSLALKYFGDACDAEVYARPDVVLGRLPQHANAITESLRSTLALSETATRPALEGALMFAQQHAAGPGYNARMVILLLTDGYPDAEDCADNTTDSVRDVAAAGFAAEPSIPTYVFVTSTALELGEVARAGGTDTTILADLGRPGALSAALNGVREREVAALPCEYELPPSYLDRVNDPDLVNLTLDGSALGRVDAQGACDPQAGGWYYDDPTAPRRIVACPSSCDRLKAGGTIEIQLDCPTIPLL